MTLNEILQFSVLVFMIVGLTLAYIVIYFWVILWLLGILGNFVDWLEVVCPILHTLVMIICLFCAIPVIATTVFTFVMLGTYLFDKISPTLLKIVGLI